MPDDRFPRRSVDVLVAATTHGAVAYDKVTETLHHLGAAGRAILDACDGTGRIDDAVATWAADAGVDPAELATTVRAHLTELTDIGLVGRTTPAQTRPPRTGADRTHLGAHHGATHPVLDHGIVFHSDDPDLIDRVDTYLGSGDPAHPADTPFVLEPHPDGRITLWTDDEWGFPDADQLVRQICGVVNEYATRTHTMAALHAAGLRLPDGRVVLLSGPPGAGKSTLAAACIAHGWDHLGDEAIGLAPATLAAVAYPKPLTLSPMSREVLGVPVTEPWWPELAPEVLRGDVRRCTGEVGPVTDVVFVRYRDGADCTIDTLDDADAIDAIAAATLNLGALAPRDLQALCDLAHTATVVHFTHGGIDAALPALLEHLGA